MSSSPEEQFVTTMRATRRHRSLDALQLIPDFIRTDHPLGQPKEKIDGGKRYERVNRVLGLAKDGVDLRGAVRDFEPEVKDLEFLSEVVFSEQTELRSALASVDAVPLPWKDPLRLAEIFSGAPLDAAEKGVFGEHVVSCTIDYAGGSGIPTASTDEGVTAAIATERRHYFYDRRLGTAYVTLYTPWIAVFLYNYATRFFPKTAEQLRLWNSEANDEPLPEQDFPPFPDSQDRLTPARLTATIEEQHFLQSCLWYSVLSCRTGSFRKRRGEAREQVQSTLWMLWHLRRHLAGKAVSVTASTARMLADGNVPPRLIRAFAELADRDLFAKSQKDSEAKARLDGVTGTVVQAIQQLPDANVGQELAMALLDTPNVEQIALGQGAELAGVVAKVPRKQEILEDYWTNVPVVLWEAVQKWDSGRGVPFCPFLKNQLRYRSKDILREVEPIATHEVQPAEDKPIESHEHESSVLNEAEALIELDERRQWLQEAIEQAGLSPTQRRVMDVYWREIREGADEEVARENARMKLGLTAGCFRVHLHEALKRIRGASRGTG